MKNLTLIIAMFACFFQVKGQNGLEGHLYKVEHDSLAHTSHILIVTKILNKDERILGPKVERLLKNNQVWFSHKQNKVEDERMKFFLKMEKRSLQKELAKDEFAELDALTTDLLGLDLIFFNRDFPFFHQKRLENALALGRKSDPFERWLQEFVEENGNTVDGVIPAENWKSFYTRHTEKEQSTALLNFSRDTSNYLLYLEDAKNRFRSFEYGKLQDNYRTVVSPEFYSSQVQKVNTRLANELEPLLNDTTTVFVCDALHFGGEFGVGELLRKKGFKVEPRFRKDAEKWRLEKQKLKDSLDAAVMLALEAAKADSLLGLESDSIVELDNDTTFTLEVAIPSDSLEVGTEPVIESSGPYSFYAKQLVLSKRLRKIIDPTGKNTSAAIDPLEGLTLTGNDSLLASIDPTTTVSDTTAIQINEGSELLLDLEEVVAPVDAFVETFLENEFSLMASVSLNQFERRLEHFIDPYELAYKEVASPLDTVNIKNWYNYVSLDGGFSIKLPSQPSLELSRSIPSKQGEIEVNIIGYNDKFNGIKYQIGYSDYPKGFKVENPDAFFTAAINNAAEKINGRIVRISNVINEFYEGREVIIAKENNILIKAKYYLIGNRLYQLLMSGTEDQINSPAGNGFFSSFKLINKEQVEWKILRSKEGTFSIQFPEVPQESTKTVNVPNEGSFPIHNYILDYKPVGVVFLMNYTDFPEDQKLGNPKSYALSTINSMSRTLFGKVVSKAYVTKGVYEGAQGLIKAKGNKYYRTQVFLVDKRMYQLVVSGPKPAVTGKEADRFFNSFKITI